jgi:GNAT superfamily N-acetyltransferase
VSGAGFIIRDAEPGDEATVVRFVRELAEYEKLSHEVVASEADFRKALFGGVPRLQGMLAEADGAPVGMALWLYTFSTFTGRSSIYLEDLYVVAQHRWRGIGRGLLRALARRGVAEGCERMDWSVLDWNTPSIAFYRSIGARPVAGWTVQRLSGDALRALAS